MRPILFIIFCYFLLPCRLAVAETQITLAAINYPPFYSEQLPNNGPVIEIVRQAYSSQGYQLKVVFIPWIRAMLWSKEGQIDGIIGAWYSAERNEHFLYSRPIYPNKMRFYKRRNHPIQYQNYQDLKQQGLLLGSVLGYNHPEGIEESGIEILYVTQDTQPFKLLSKGRVDLIVVDQDYARYILKQPDLSQYAPGIEPMPQVLSEKMQHLIISKRTSQAKNKLDSFNKGYILLKEQGRLKDILLNGGLSPALAN